MIHSEEMNLRKFLWSEISEPLRNAGFSFTIGRNPDNPLAIVVYVFRDENFQIDERELAMSGVEGLKEKLKRGFAECLRRLQETVKP